MLELPWMPHMQSLLNIAVIPCGTCILIKTSFLQILTFRLIQYCDRDLDFMECV